MARIAILYADEDTRWRAAAVDALAAFTHALTPLRAGSVLDPGIPVLVIWTGHAARHQGAARAIVGAAQDVIVWRPDGAPAPAWLADAVPIGPEMPTRSLALMAQYALAEEQRRARAPAPRRRGLGRLALAAGVGAALTALIAGAAMLHATRAPEQARATPGGPVTGLRGLQ